MESSNYLEIGVKELTSEYLILVNGGSFMLNLGFFFREVIIDVVNGGGLPGCVAVGTDLGINYRP